MDPILLQEGTSPIPAGEAGAVVLVASLLITVAWLLHLYG